MKGRWDEGMNEWMNESEFILRMFACLLIQHQVVLLKSVKNP